MRKIVVAALLLIGAGAADPAATEIAKWKAFLASDAARGGVWDDVKGDAQPVLDRAADAIHDGMRMLAINRLAAVWPNLVAAKWVAAHGSSNSDEGVEREWRRAKNALDETPGDLSSIKPAAVRAFAETAVPQIHAYYDASLDYGRNTAPAAGLYYLGSAYAEKEFIAFARTLSQKTTKHAPATRAIDADLDALQHDLVSLYRPPLSIDRHSEFIRANSTLKEARELNAAGLRYGALLRYVEASRRFAQLRAKPLARDVVTARIRDFAAKIASSDVDHSIADIYVESAQSDLANAKSDLAVSSAIAAYALPDYFKALSGAPAQKPSTTKPKVTVTLVRWPYT